MSQLQEMLTLNYAINFIPSFIAVTSIWILLIPAIVAIAFTYSAKEDSKYEDIAFKIKFYLGQKKYTKKEIEDNLIWKNKSLIKFFFENFIGCYLFGLFIVIFFYFYWFIVTAYEVFIHNPFSLWLWTFPVVMIVVFLVFGFFFFKYLADPYFHLFMIPYLFITDRKRFSFYLKK